MKVKISELLFIGIMMPIISTILAYFLDVGIVVYSGIILTTVLTFISFFKIKIKKEDFLILFPTVVFFLYCFLLLFFIFFKKGSINFLLPVFFIAICIQIIALSSDIYFKKYINLFFFTFAVVQFVFCILQYSYFTFGFGIKSNVEYDAMIAGTFSNSNDLASLTVLFSVFLFLVDDVSRRTKLIFFIISFIILVLTVSRFALFMFFVVVIFFNHGKFLSKVLVVSFVSLLFYLLSQFVLNYDSTGIVALDRIVQRLQTISTVTASSNLDSDSSIDIRSNSYLHFFSNIFHLGFGSLSYGDYRIFSGGFNGDRDLIFRNPHSLLIEVAYWQGYLGLGMLSTMFFSWIRGNKQNLKILFVILLISFIPSSVILNLMFWEMSFLLMVYSSYLKKIK